MKSRMWCMIARTLLPALFLTPQLSAQDNQDRQKQQHHYKLINLGTLGGPQSYSFFGDAQSLNNRGMAVGQSDTTIPDPNYPNFNPYIGNGNPDPFIQHAFIGENGVLTDLGALPGVNGSSVGWINRRGMTAGASTNSTIDPITGWPEEIAVLWKDGHIINLGTLGGNESQADAVNNKGQVAGFAANAVPDSFPSPLGLPGFGTQQRAFLWENGVMRDLGTLGGPDAVALLLNERGEVAGESYTSSIPNPVTGIPPVDPFLWESGEMLDLGSFGGTFCILGCVNWLNNRGQVAGSSNLPGDTTAHPFLWSKTEGLEDLGTLGGTFGSAFWVNESGEVVGASTNQNDQEALAFLWKDGVMTNLGTLAGDRCSSAENINSRGQIVGSSDSSPQCSFFHADTHAFLWENGGPMIDLNIFVPRGSELKLFEAGYVNERGEILVLGLLPNGDSRTALLVPCERDDDGCQGEGSSVTQNNPGSATQQVRTAIPSSRATATILDRLRSRWNQRHRLPDPAVQSAQ